MSIRLHLATLNRDWLAEFGSRGHVSDPTGFLDICLNVISVEWS